MAWVALATVTHLPATVVPVGHTASGLPVGIQIVGPYLEDRTTLAAAGLIEKLLGGFVPPPGRVNYSRCSAKVQNCVPGGPLKQPTS